MDRDIKVFNRPIMEKIQKRNQQLHMQRLKNIKSGISNRTMPNTTFYANKNQKVSNKKAYMMEEQKNLQIEKQNVILFNKMMKIMHRPDPNQPPNYENRNLYNSRQRFQSQANRNLIENEKLSQENRYIFQRLEKQKPTISTKKLKEDRMRNLTLLRFMGKYPNNKAISAHRMSCDYSSNGNSRATGQSKFQENQKNEQRKKKLNTTLYFKYNREYDQEHDEDEFNMYANEIGELDSEVYDAQMRKYQEEVKRIKERDAQTSVNRRKFMSQSINRKQPNLDSEQSEGDSHVNDLPKVTTFLKNKAKHESGDSPPLKRIPSHHNNQDRAHQIVLYEGAAILNQLPAQIKFTRNFSSYVIRATFIPKIPKMRDFYEVSIPEQEGNQFFSQFNYEYKKIATLLIIEEDQLVIHVSPDHVSSDRKQEKKQEKEENVRKQNNVKFFEDDQGHKMGDDKDKEEQLPELPTRQSNTQHGNLNTAKYEQDLQVSID